MMDVPAEKQCDLAATEVAEDANTHPSGLSDDSRAAAGRAVQGSEAGAKSRGRLVIPVLVWAISAIYLSGFLDRNWVPHDEGLLGTSAERVLNGELPHRDFDDVYTGGLAQLHALGFKLLGIKLTSIRLVLFAFTMLFVAALYAIAARAAPPWLAGLVTLTGVVWSVPNYFAGLPSWYIVFFTVFGLLALLRYIDTGCRRWLFVAGLWGGAGVLMKIVAVYYIAAVLLFLAYREQVASQQTSDERQGRSLGLLVFTGLAAALFSCLLVVLIRRDLRPMEVVNYVLPGVSLSGVLVWNEWRAGRGAFLFRLRRIAAAAVPFFCGVLIPIACFATPYVWAGALGDLYRGMFVLPLKRLEQTTTTVSLPSVICLLFPLLLALALRFAGARRFRRVYAALLAALAVVVLIFAKSIAIYLPIWWSASCSLPIVVLAACWLLVWPALDHVVTGTRRQEVFLLVSAASLISLLQYPYAAPVYFCYVAPLLLLSVQFVLASRPAPSHHLTLGFFAFYFAFGLMWMNTGDIYCLGRGFTPESSARLTLRRLTLSRAGLLVPSAHQEQYTRLVELIERLTPPGAYIYAAPDCPEVYFLSARRNPTRTMYDLFDDPSGRVQSLIKMLDEKQIELVVVNRDPWFSAEIHPELVAALTARYPQKARIGPFVVGWKAAPSPEADSAPAAY